MIIHTLRPASTSCFLIPASAGFLAFDTGWPDSFSEYRDMVKMRGLCFKDIKLFFVSHFHIDHAGLAGMFIQNGICGVVFENQIASIDEMESLLERKGYRHQKIDRQKLTLMKIGESRRWLQSIGINGEVVQIFGHGDQSISLVLDSGEAFIGDLPPDLNCDELVTADWKRLRALNARHIYPAHAREFELEIPAILI